MIPPQSFVPETISYSYYRNRLVPKTFFFLFRSRIGKGVDIEEITLAISAEIERLLDKFDQNHTSTVKII